MPVRASRRSAAEWANIIAGYRAGSADDVTFCRQRGLKLATFRKHKYRLTSSERVQHKSPFKVVTISRVSPQEACVTVPACITVHGFDGVKVELPPTIDIDAVAQLAKALSHGR